MESYLIRSSRSSLGTRLSGAWTRSDLVWRISSSANGSVFPGLATRADHAPSAWAVRRTFVITRCSRAIHGTGVRHCHDRRCPVHISSRRKGHRCSASALALRRSDRMAFASNRRYWEESSVCMVSAQRRTLLLRLQNGKAGRSLLLPNRVMLPHRNLPGALVRRGPEIRTRRRQSRSTRRSSTRQLAN